MHQRGFTYLVLLFMVAIMGAVLAATAMVWHTLAQRDKEQELLYAGDAFRRAIGLYYERTPGAGTPKQYPKKLDESAGRQAPGQPDALFAQNLY